MKRFLSLLVGLLILSLLSGCLLQPFGKGGSKFKPSSARDVIDYSALDFKEGEVLIKANASGSLEQVLAQEGSAILHEWPQIGWVVASVPPGESVGSFIAKLRSYKEVLLAEPNVRYELPEPDGWGDIELLALAEAEEYDKQWGLRNINAEAAWEITTGSPDVIVAIIDTGVDASHPEFDGKAFVEGFDATGEGTPTLDLHGHGTHVAGIAADDGRSGKIAGVAWDCPIMPVRVMDSDYSIWTGYLTDAMLHLGDYAEAHPEKRIVANMSIGGRGYSFAFKDAIDYAAERGVLLVTSAGNDYMRVISYPGAYNGVVTVAASTPWNEKADFSTMGWWNSVAAPGVNIYSTVTGGGYESWQGTSMASPFVCGAAALLLSQYPELSTVELKNQIEQTAQGSGFTEELGYGVIDAAAILGELRPMAYGALKVKTNLVLEDEDDESYGVITVFSSDGVLKAYGTTGMDGSHTFHALQPGDYTVTVAFYSAAAEGWELASQQASVGVDKKTEVIFEFEL
jgi:thermitase